MSDSKFSPEPKQDLISALPALSGSASDYQAQLAAWKAKQGVPDPGSEHSVAELKMFAEEKMDEAKSWCIFCDVKLPVREMRLITVTTDPYTQTISNETTRGGYIPNRHRVRACPKCFHEHYEQES